LLLVSGGKDTDNLLIRQFVDLVVGRNGKAERAGRGAVIGGLSFGVPIVFVYRLYRGVMNYFYLCGL
jgi:hypothetical protein